ncbi:Wzy polymerase domain-containing protein [Candidatus Ferrigenium straubiae]|uniref:PglL family O-oligosaccharyltransferase n=1 Tax=Candidatus Ferrigenium straubiae TaxID=2919506 RepID=UPI003F4AEC31
MQNLNTTGLKNPFQSLRLTHISLALVGMMWVLPFLHYRHQYPLTTFYQEWWSALLGMLALMPLVARDFWRQPEIPRIVQLPVMLLVVVLLQSALGKIAYFDQSLLYALYLLFAALLMVLGARLRDCFGLAEVAPVLAVFLLIGAELSALAGVLQHYRWDTPLNSVIVMKTSSSVFGNLAQPNHFANYVALGLASLGLLLQRQRLKAGYVIVLAVPLLFVMTLSGSRSSWLYLLMMAGLAWWWARRDAVQRPLLRYSLFLIAGFGVMHLVVQLPFLAGAGSSVDTVQRLFGEEAGESIRLYLWREAGLMFLQSPWLGAGFGQFAWQHFQLLPVLQPGNITGLYNNAHNLVFQLAAEAGIAGLLALFGSLGIWLYGLRRATLSAAHWWGHAALGVLAIHSLLEYPLWYAYFIAVAAFLLGALDETRYRLELRNLGRMSVAAVLLMGLMTLAQLRSGYHELERTLAIRPAASTSSGQASAADSSAFDRTWRGLVAVHEGSRLSPYAELFMSSLIQVSGERIEDKLELNGRVLRFAPIGAVVYRQALLLAQAGQQEQARTLLLQAIWSYPGDFSGVRRQMEELAEKDPVHFSALLEFALQKEQEWRRAVHHQ